MCQWPWLLVVGTLQVMVIDEQALSELDAEQLREVTQRLLTELRHQRALNEKLTYECALLKRLKFAAQSERHSTDQRTLLEEELDSDLAAVAHEIEQLRPAQPAAEKQQPKRTPLPTHLPRREVCHEPTSTTCQCGCQLKRIGEDVAEKLDYVPGVFTVERHVRGKWACAKCQTITQAPVAAHVIEKGIPTTGLLAQVLVAKYADHQPLYRQENIFARAGLAIPRSTLAQWVGTCGARLQPLVDALKAEVLEHRVLHGDETPVAMLKPGNGKTHRAYLWAYAPGAFEATRAVVYDFCESRAGEHARAFLGDWRGSLICDDYAGYKASFSQGVTEAGCLAHAGASSSTCTRPTRARLPSSPCSSSPGSMRSNGPSRKNRDPSGYRLANSTAGRYWTPCTRGWCCNASRWRATRPRPRPWTTASSDGPRSRASSMTRNYRRTTTGSRTRSGPLPSVATTGCLPAACARASEQQP